MQNYVAPLVRNEVAHHQARGVTVAAAAFAP